MNADHDKVLELLRELGDSPEEIAQSLQARGIQGVRNASCSCPLALYLRSKGYPYARVHVRYTEDDITGDDSEEVESALVEGALPSDSRERVEIPTVFAKFVESFDNGLYPALVQPGRA